MEGRRARALYLNSMFVTTVAVCALRILRDGRGLRLHAARVSGAATDVTGVLLIGLLLPPPTVAIPLFTQLRDMGTCSIRRGR